MNIHEVICQNKLLSANDDSRHKHTILRGGGGVIFQIRELPTQTGKLAMEDDWRMDQLKPDQNKIRVWGCMEKKCQRKLAAINTRRKKNTQGIDTTLKYLTEVLIPFKSENKFQQKFL